MTFPDAKEDVSRDWADDLGLAEAPLFADDEGIEPEHHRVLLDGGSGSFAISVFPEGDSRPDTEIRSWIWSADLSHHLGIRGGTVEVARWDDPSAQRTFSLESVKLRLEPFYRFLTLDRAVRHQSVVDHALDLFRRLRALVAHDNHRDQGSIHVFLFALASLIAKRRPGDAKDDVDAIVRDFSLDPCCADLIQGLEWSKIAALLDHYRYLRGFPGGLEMLPTLAVRHAGGLVFQEAHFELLSSTPPDLFGYLELPQVKVSTRGGTHFTPPPLARSIVEQVLKQLHPLANRERLVILDPACGSGAFLHESLRTLRREGYKGHIHLIGQDSSPHAVAMARFVLNRARHDWHAGNIQIEVRQGNSLSDEALPAADVVVMNPPFISWPGLEDGQRQELRRVLGSMYVGRADYSMGFVVRALECLREGGALGTLLPGSLLSAKSSERWRRHLLDSATPVFVGIIGDHGLFPRAMVQVATLVLSKADSADQRSSYATLWTGEAKGVAGDALRTLRRMGTPAAAAVSGDGWRVGRESASDLERRSDWRPRPRRLEPILDALRASVPTTTADLFRVRQGIRTGLRQAFFLSAEEYADLPERERPFFRPVVENRNIDAGRILAGDYLFYPDTEGLPAIPDEDALRERVATFFKTHLDPHREELSQRAALVRRGAGAVRRWWELDWPRDDWLAKFEQKIVTAYFGRSGSFAWDDNGIRLVVQGHGWTPKTLLQNSFSSIDVRAREKFSFLFLGAYVALLTSRPFTMLLAEYCNHVAGGQFDLSKRYVDHVPMPNLPAAARDPIQGPAIAELDVHGRAMAGGELVPSSRVDELTAGLYGVPIEQWPIGI